MINVDQEHHPFSGAAYPCPEQGEPCGVSTLGVSALKGLHATKGSGQDNGCQQQDPCLVRPSQLNLFESMYLNACDNTKDQECSNENGFLQEHQAKGKQPAVLSLQSLPFSGDNAETVNSKDEQNRTVENKNLRERIDGETRPVYCRLVIKS